MEFVKIIKQTNNDVWTEHRSTEDLELGCPGQASGCVIGQGPACLLELLSFMTKTSLKISVTLFFKVQ